MGRLVTGAVVAVCALAFAIAAFNLAQFSSDGPLPALERTALDDVFDPPTAPTEDRSAARGCRQAAL